jgi:predicted Holliday junction resolvase-like endonuclease
MENLPKVFDELNSILVFCPCCGEINRVSETRPYLKGAKPHTRFDQLDAESRALDRIEEKLDERLQRLREKAQERGWKKARGRLRKLDPTFYGSGLEPQDVKVIFDPVEYVVFDGMTKNALRQVLLMGQHAANSSQERIQTSLQQTLKKGNVEFVTLRVTDNGTVEKE